jgi:hypothetical protein
MDVVIRNSRTGAETTYKQADLLILARQLAAKDAGKLTRYWIHFTESKNLSSLRVDVRLKNGIHVMRSLAL